MKYLLDTHALWYHATGNREMIPAAIVEALSGSLAKDLHCLDVSLYEIARHLAMGRIQTPDPLKALKLLEQNYSMIHSTAEIAWIAASMHWQKSNGRGEHLDPADRAIMATAQLMDLTLVTADREMHAFAPACGVKVFW